MTENTQPDSSHLPVLKVLGLGGGGSNAVNRMIELGLQGVEFIVANTDMQALNSSLAPNKISLGPNLTRGLGAGGDPIVGAKAAEESYNALYDALKGADMVFLTAGMGGGTGSGAIPIAGEIAQSLGATVIAIVTMPFSFELGKRQSNASEGLKLLRPNTDTLIAIPNDRLLSIAPKDLPLEVAFRLADDVLRQAVQGIAELVTEPGLVNVDFGHVRQMMKLGGGALMAIGQGEGNHKAVAAIDQALNHPLMESVSLPDAAGIIANFSGGKELTLFEVREALEYIHQLAEKEIDVVMGYSNDTRLGDRAQVILVITGLGAPTLEEVLPGAERLSNPIDFQVSREPLLEKTEYAAAPILTAQPPIRSRIVEDLDIPAFMRRHERYTPV